MFVVTLRARMRELSTAIITQCSIVPLLLARTLLVSRVMTLADSYVNVAGCSVGLSNAVSVVTRNRRRLPREGPLQPCLLTARECTHGARHAGARRGGAIPAFRSWCYIVGVLISPQRHGRGRRVIVECHVWYGTRGEPP